jgi:hypothetical protein
MNSDQVVPYVVPYAQAVLYIAYACIAETLRSHLFSPQSQSLRCLDHRPTPAPMTEEC